MDLYRCACVYRDIGSGGIQPDRTGSLEPVPRQSHILRTGY